MTAAAIIHDAFVLLVLANVGATIWLAHHARKQHRLLQKHHDNLRHIQWVDPLMTADELAKLDALDAADYRKLSKTGALWDEVRAKMGRLTHDL